MKQFVVYFILTLAALPAKAADPFLNSGMEFDRLVALLGDNALRELVCRLSSERYTPASLSTALGIPEGQVMRRPVSYTHLTLPTKRIV